MVDNSLHTAKFLAEKSRKKHDPYGELGRQVVLALLSQPRWVTRTVESVRFVDRNVVSRRVVRHFVVPRDEAARPQVDGRYVMPVYAVRKGQFISCDLLDGGGHLVSLAPLQDRCKLSYLALLDLARTAKVNEEDALFNHLWQIVESPEPVSLDKFDDFLGRSRRGRELRDSEMYRLVELLSCNYLIYRAVPINQRSDDHVLTMRLERRVPDSRADFELAGKEPPSRWLQIRRWLGLASHEFRHEFIQTAGSTHIEVEAPDGIALGYRVLDHLGFGVTPSFEHEVLASHAARGTSKRRARFLIPRSAPFGAYAATINLRPGAGIMRDAGQVVALLLCGLIAIVAARRSDINGEAGLVDAAASLLLILPALVALVAARPAEHPRVTRVLVGPRILTLSVIALSALAATTLIVNWPTAILWVLAGVSLLLSVLLSGVFFGARYYTSMDVEDTLYGNREHPLPASIKQTTPPVDLPRMTRIG